MPQVRLTRMILFFLDFPHPPMLSCNHHPSINDAPHQAAIKKEDRQRPNRIMAEK